MEQQAVRLSRFEQAAFNGLSPPSPPKEAWLNREIYFIHMAMLRWTLSSTPTSLPLLPLEDLHIRIIDVVDETSSPTFFRITFLYRRHTKALSRKTDNDDDNNNSNNDRLERKNVSYY